MKKNTRTHYVEAGTGIHRKESVTRYVLHGTEGVKYVLQLHELHHIFC